MRRAEAHVLVAVAEARGAVLVPAIGAAAGVVVGEEFPRLAGGGVVFKDGVLGALGEVRAHFFQSVRRAREAASRSCSAVMSSVDVRIRRASDSRIEEGEGRKSTRDAPLRSLSQQTTTNGRRREESFGRGR